MSKTKTISSVERVYSSFHFSFCFVLYTISNWPCYSKVVFYMCFVYFEVKVWYKISCCKKNSCFCLMITLFRCPLITENKHLLPDPELSSVTRNYQIYIMPFDTLKIGIYKLKDFMNCIEVKRNNVLNSIYSSVSLDFRFKETPYVNFFTDPELSSSLYHIIKMLITKTGIEATTFASTRHVPCMRQYIWKICTRQVREDRN